MKNSLTNTQTNTPAQGAKMTNSIIVNQWQKLVRYTLTEADFDQYTAAGIMMEAMEVDEEGDVDQEVRIFLISESFNTDLVSHLNTLFEALKFEGSENNELCDLGFDDLSEICQVGEEVWALVER
jgi:hypothetical protein